MKFDRIEQDYLADHSKIAISLKSEEKKIVCFGDLNRSPSQNKRSGGTFCFYNEKLWNKLDNIFVEKQKC